MRSRRINWHAQHIRQSGKIRLADIRFVVGQTPNFIICSRLDLNQSRNIMVVPKEVKTISLAWVDFYEAYYCLWDEVAERRELDISRPFLVELGTCASWKNV